MAGASMADYRVITNSTKRHMAAFLYHMSFCAIIYLFF